MNQAARSTSGNSCVRPEWGGHSMENVLLVISSVRRLNLYVDVYALSRWRIAAAIWMGVVAIALLWVMVRIFTQRSNEWLVRVNTLTAIAVVYACSFVNFDGLIAAFNVSHCQELKTGQVPLDVEYLERLGFESLPSLRWFAQREELRGTGVVTYASTAADRLESHLRDDLSDWRGWTWRRARIADRVGLVVEPAPEAQLAEP